MNEIWKPVPGFEGKYIASNLGKVKSLKRKRVWEERILSENSTAKKYIAVTLGKKSRGIHRVIAETFIPNPLNLPVVDHIDGNPKNNCVSNLQWTSHRDNIQLYHWRKKRDHF